MDYQYTAIVLGKRDISEADRIYILYTLEAGRIDAVARGVRRPNARLSGALEPVTLSDVTVTRGRGRGNVTSAVAENVFFDIKNCYGKITRIFGTFRNFMKIISGSAPDPKIFALLLSYLETMDSLGQEEEKMDILTAGFLLRLLDLAGYTVEVNRCVKCGGALSPGKNVFSAKRGGILCEKHTESGLLISDEGVKLLRIFLSNRLENFVKIKIKPADLKSAERMIEEMVRWITV